MTERRSPPPTGETAAMTFPQVIGCQRLSSPYNPSCLDVGELAGIAWRACCEGVSRVFDAAVLSRVGTGKKHPHTREARYDYDAFGNIISQTGSTPKSSSSGLMRTRELAATVARGNRVERLLQRVSRVFVGREKTSAHARSLPARESMAASKTTPSQQPLPGLV